jgi:hypothetical protein
MEMQLQSMVSFDEVRAAFLRENDVQCGKNQWALKAIEIAEEQFGHWGRVILSSEDILGVMLPHHTRCGPEVVPPCGSIVSDAIERLKSLPSSDTCRKTVDELSARTPSLIFLSSAPINHSDYPDFRALVERNYKGLTHLDGLHRLIAWGRSGRSGIAAYVAGLDSEPAVSPGEG